MHKHPIALMGASFNNVTLAEAVQHIYSSVNMHTKNHDSGYVSTINVDFMAKAHTVNWNHIADPELLDIYRTSHFVFCDGKPLIWLSWLLGSPLKERVTGIDILPRIAELFAQNGKSIYLLGGTEHINKVAGLVLEAINPGLRIVGRASPQIFTDGEELLHISEQDASITEAINQAAPDLLLIAFGNPKQEKWFNRVKGQLNVPVSIGIGGCFDLLSGAHSRAPAWMQRVGLEWFYRLLQDPMRLASRYFFDAWKFLGISIPLLGYHSISRALSWLSSKRKTEPPTPPLLFLSSTQTIAIIPLPRVIDNGYCHLALTQLDGAFNQDTVILDFEIVRHITLEGFALLLKIWQKAQRNGKELYAMHVPGDIKLLMKVHRCWDLIKDSVMENPQQVIRALIQGKSHPNYFESIQQQNDCTVIYFFGCIGTEQNKGEYIKKLTPLLREKNCLLDFRYCTHIENAGFSFLLKLQQFVNGQNQQLYVRKRSPQLKRLFGINRLGSNFQEAPPCQT